MNIEVIEMGTQIDIVAVGSPSGDLLTMVFTEEGVEPRSLVEARRTLEVETREPCPPEPSRNR